ncbi:store-operated calcium entry-associated regulatory factor [Chanos chanos]|uniref:Store-operated calcium entry-associated regulatory factor n=1 Tax=Chanos chanos TaxID=29144 RepID=A0A6J2WHT5_CHACN|nr:store-operated calcium entry-associated regulatory factor [Chanos chanos]
MGVRFVLLVLLNFLFVVTINCWNDGAVLLRDVQVLTLYKGKYTTARRTNPVPQLQCVGGSAGCSAFFPEVVQCQNKGWDGIDAQWECKADMDNAYRFGRVEVSCEGYNHPNDPYILKGSCGLEYTLELTAEGRQQNSYGSRHSTGFSDFASSFASGFFSNNRHGSQSYGQTYQNASEEGFGGLVVVGLFLLLAYGVYKMFLCNPTQGHQRFPDNGDSSGSWPGGYGHTGPPPPGFKPDFTGQSSGYQEPNSGYGFRNEYTHPGTNRQGSMGGNGFFSGMGMGGLLGYLFGNQRRQPRMGHTGFHHTQSNHRPNVPPASTGTRTASGFGGTKRR